MWGTAGLCVDDDCLLPTCCTKTVFLTESMENWARQRTRPIWSTKQVSGQSRLCRETMSQQRCRGDTQTLIRELIKKNESTETDSNTKVACQWTKVCFT